MVLTLLPEDHHIITVKAHVGGSVLWKEGLYGAGILQFYFLRAFEVVSLRTSPV